MRFNKPALALVDQVQLLQRRGLIVADAARAEHYLSNIGYYRLSAYSPPFEQPTPAGQARLHQFKPGITFEQVLGLYVFDRKLRLLVMEAIERLEVAVRTRWAHAMAMRHGAHAHMSANTPTVEGGQGMSFPRYPTYKDSGVAYGKQILATLSQELIWYH